ncbi:MAG TPA: VCBS repeat-containing protein [Candidatus Competibacter sp.]|nr:VCBS repeat-containing protein [Candidatus Competibacter sp.]HUM95174.1 VCBS repeat-containing protein [Candidatus Competibacter sp.]
MQKQLSLVLTALVIMLPINLQAAQSDRADSVKVGTLGGPTEKEPVWNDSEGRYSRFLVRSGAFHALVDDLDGDGRLDLLFTSHGGNMIRVFRQTATRRFEATDEQEIAGFHPNDTIALPGTPKRYVINAEGRSQLRVVAAQPDGRLTLISDYSQPHPLGTTPFSWPGWGPLSLAVAPYTGSSLTLLRDFNPEKGETKEAIKIATEADPQPARLADLNGDGVPELVFPTFHGNKVWAIEHAGLEQAPGLRELASFKKGWPRQAVPFDLDQDGAMDLLVPMSVRPRIVGLLNDGKGQFTRRAPISYPGAIGVHTLAVGQDAGGRYLLAGGSRALVLYRERKEQAGDFENRVVERPDFTWPNRVELVDVDGDRWLDAVVADQGAAQSEIIYGPLWDIFGKLSVNPTTTVKPD